MQVDAQLLPAPVVVETKLKPAEMLAPLSQASEPSELPPPLPLCCWWVSCFIWSRAVRALLPALPMPISSAKTL
eukprot:s359_g27.t1